MTAPERHDSAAAAQPVTSRRTARQLAAALVAATVVCGLLGLAAGSEGWSLEWQADWPLIRDLRAPRTAGAFLAGALLGLAGALAQGLFRNPLADPYLLGAAAGAGLGVVLVLSASGLLSGSLGLAAVDGLMRLGLVGAAFLGALAGVGLTLMLARGAGRPLQLLLAGVVVGVLLSAVADLLVLLSPAAMRGRQVFLLGTTSFLGWDSVGVLGLTWLAALPLAMRFARALDALVLGDASAISLGLPLARTRLLLVTLLAASTGAAVAQAGLVAFIGLVAPHLVRRWVAVTHGTLLALASLSGGALLLAADVAARRLVAPEELPVGVLTAVLGGLYLLALLYRRSA